MNFQHPAVSNGQSAAGRVGIDDRLIVRAVEVPDDGVRRHARGRTEIADLEGGERTGGERRQIDLVGSGGKIGDGVEVRDVVDDSSEGITHSVILEVVDASAACQEVAAAAPYQRVVVAARSDRIET